MYSCSEPIEEKISPLNEIQGEWLEKMDSVTMQWTFHNHEVKVGDFTHYFQLEDNQLSISGINHEIIQLNKDTLRVVNQEGVGHTFVRKSKGKVDEKA